MKLKLKFEIDMRNMFKFNDMYQKLETVIEKYGRITDITTQYEYQGIRQFEYTQLMDCQNCRTKVHALVSKQEFKTGGGFHLRADCPQCQKFIKFIRQ